MKFLLVFLMLLPASFASANCFSINPSDFNSMSPCGSRGGVGGVDSGSGGRFDGMAGGGHEGSTGHGGIPGMSYSEYQDFLGKLRKANPKGFRCEAEYQCWADKSIGHTCLDYTMAFTGSEGYIKLKAQDCCSRTQAGGRKNSIKFIGCGL